MNDLDRLAMRVREGDLAAENSLMETLAKVARATARSRGIPDNDLDDVVAEVSLYLLSRGLPETWIPELGSIETFTRERTKTQIGKYWEAAGKSRAVGLGDGSDGDGDDGSWVTWFLGGTPAETASPKKHPCEDSCTGACFDQLSEIVVAKAGSPSKGVQYRETVARVRDAVGSLEKRLQRIICLLMRGQSLRAIAQAVEGLRPTERHAKTVSRLFENAIEPILAQTGGLSRNTYPGASSRRPPRKPHRRR